MKGTSNSHVKDTRTLQNIPISSHISFTSTKIVFPKSVIGCITACYENFAHSSAVNLTARYVSYVNVQLKTADKYPAS